MSGEAAYSNPLPWGIKSGRWADASGALVALTQADERAMFLAEIADLDALLAYEKARVQTAENIVSKLNAELGEVKRDRDTLREDAKQSTASNPSPPGNAPGRPRSSRG